MTGWIMMPGTNDCLLVLWFSKDSWLYIWRGLCVCILMETIGYYCARSIYRDAR